MTAEKVRFAPSPTGLLHVGNLRTALVNYLYARHAGGAFMLRIDDTDEERSTAEFEAAIRADLAWMGMVWDMEDRQSDRLRRYDEALQQLLADQRAYACYETAEELALKRKSQLMAGKPPVYDRAALRLSAAEKSEFEAQGRRPHYRFLLDQDSEVVWQDLVRGPQSIQMSSLSDPVLLREDGRVIYTLASVVDDLDHGITTILRGEDHVTNSAAQIQLFEALGAAAPKMGHLALLAGAEGEGLSKRLGSLSISELRAEGIEAGAIASLLARIGTSQPVEAHAGLAPLVEAFDIGHFGRATAKFDAEELRQLNGRILQQYEFEAVADRLADLQVGGGADFWEAVRGNLNQLAEAQDWWQICATAIAPVIEDSALCAAAADLLPDGELDGSVWPGWTKAVAEATGKKGRALFMPLRLAITGRSSGPEVASLLSFIGRERLIARLRGQEA